MKAAMRMTKKITKRFLLILLVSTAAILTGCTTKFIYTENIIAVPEVKSIPMQGTWQIDEIFSYTGSPASNSDTENMDKAEKWIGKTIEFGKNSLFICGEFWSDVNYRIKRVNAEEYFLLRFGERITNLADITGISSEEIYVTTVSSQGKFLYEIVNISDERAIINIDSWYFFIRKISDEISEKPYIRISDGMGSRSGDLYGRDKASASGILLGLRSPSESNLPNISNLSENLSEASESSDKGSGTKVLPRFKYRTLWISYRNFELQPVLEADEIYLPRISGFWKVGVKEITREDKYEEIMYAYRVVEDKAKNFIISNSIEPSMLTASNHSLFWIDKENGILRRSIVYAGNDYVSIELTGKGRLKGNNGTDTWEINMLQTLPVDNIESLRGVKLSDICGEDGITAMKSAIEGWANNYNVIDERLQEENFALFRKTGHWFFKGRISIVNDGVVSYRDYNINLIPPSNMVAYDNLSLPWTYIKDKVPQAVDAYTSPNNDIAIILTKGSLLVFEITDGKLSNAPIGKMELGTEDTVVMAEWATDDYVERWENSFINNNEIRILEIEKYK